MLRVSVLINAGSVTCHNPSGLRRSRRRMLNHHHVSVDPSRHSRYMSGSYKRKKLAKLKAAVRKEVNVELMGE